MDKLLWLNLPSADLVAAKRFYQALGFEINETHSSAEMLGVFAGSQRVPINFFKQHQFSAFVGGAAAVDARVASEVLLSIGASSAAEVDELARRADGAGGAIYAKPGWKDGWMYGCGFADLDGHRWNPLFMDFSRLPKK